MPVCQLKMAGGQKKFLSKEDEERPQNQGLWSKMGKKNTGKNEKNSKKVLTSEKNGSIINDNNKERRESVMFVTISNNMTMCKVAGIR